MRFVHIIEINDPRNPLLDLLTVEQVWRGLVHRAERPADFLPQLEGCLIVMRGETNIARELDFGSFSVRDRVRLTPMSKITFESEAAPNIPAGKLTISIECRDRDQLQLRFTYDIDHDRSDDEAMEARYDAMLRSAYLQADIDSVKLIRQLAAAGSI